MAKETKQSKEKQADAGAAPAAEPLSKERQIGYHTGCLETLAKERQELTRILQIIEQLMQMHIGALKELGVDLQKQAEAAAAAAPAPKQKKPIEDIL